MSVSNPFTAGLKADVLVDTSGSRCPIPLLKAKQNLKQLDVGQTVHVISTDPSSVGDFDAMLRHLPHTLLEQVTLETETAFKTYHFLIQKG